MNTEVLARPCVLCSPFTCALPLHSCSPSQPPFRHAWSSPLHKQGRLALLGDLTGPCVLSSVLFLQIPVKLTPSLSSNFAQNVTPSVNSVQTTQFQIAMCPSSNLHCTVLLTPSFSYFLTFIAYCLSTPFEMINSTRVRIFCSTTVRMHPRNSAKNIEA